MHVRATVIALAGSLLLISCGGSGSPASSSPTAPTSTSAGGTASTVVTINIIGDKGTLSFSPNPATVPEGQLVSWKNTDSIVHRVVFDGLVDTGDINPGATSAPQALGAVSKGYHCSIHPGMVGSLNGAATPTPGAPCDIYGC